MKKYFWCLLCAICAAICLVTVASAANETVYYSVIGGRLYFNKESGAITGCDEKVTEADIPSVIEGVSVVAIGRNAFYGCNKLTAVTIPNSVTSIGKTAFFACKSLLSVAIPASVISIGDEAFASCQSLTAINVNAANSNYSSTDGVLFNKNQTELICYPAGKSGAYVIPDSVTSFGFWSFYKCKNLTSVVIPDSVTSIDGCAFQSCSALTTVMIPSSVTSIGYATFDGCSSLTSVTIPDSVTSIDAYAFQSCKSLTTVTIPSGVLFIAQGAFNDCISLTKVKIPNSVTYIDWSAFEGCSSLTSVTIPDSVTSIGQEAFYKCSGLRTVTIPENVTFIGNSAFRDCDELKDVYYGGTQEQWDKLRGHGNIPSNTIIHYNSVGEVGNEVKETRIIYTSGVADAGKELYPMTVQWGWDLFKDSAYTPDNRKAIVAAALSRAAEAGQDKAEALLQTLGFTFYYSDNYKFDWTDVEHPAFTMGHKMIELNGRETDFYILVIRGTKGFDDALTDGGSWFGAFGSAAAYIRSELDKFYDTSHVVAKENSVFFITGHSLGAATGNLLAAKLSEDFSGDRVFAYTFATQAPLIQSDKGSHRNIFNLINKEDIIANLPTWRLNRNGITAFFSRQKAPSKIYDNFKDITSGKDLKHIMKWNVGWSLTAHSMDTYLAFLLTDSKALEKQLEASGKYSCVHMRPAGSGKGGGGGSLFAADSVNIEIFDEDGDMIGRVVSGETDVSVTQGVYVETEDNGVRVYMLGDGDFTVKMTGFGQVDYTAESFDLSASEVTESKVFSNVQLSAETALNSAFGSSIQPDEVQLLTVDASGAFTGKIETDGSRTDISTDAPTLSTCDLAYESGQVSVTAVVDNFTDKSVNGNLFAALYENGQFLDCVCLSECETPRGREIRRKLEFNRETAIWNAGNLKAKLFYVDSTTVQSLTPAAEIWHENKE